VRTWWIIAGSVLTVGAIAATLLSPPPKRWVNPAAWRLELVRQRLRQRRPMLRVYTGLVLVAALVLVVWVLPSVLTERPHIPNSADRHQAITNARTGLALVLTALGAAGGLAFTARTYRLGQETYRLSRQGHITDRYSKAIEQLGDEKVEVRLGGIYALERLMHDSPADQPTIMETLAAFVRQHAPPSSRLALPARGTPPRAPAHPTEDVQAVLTVLGRRNPVDKERPIDLSRTDLTGARLVGATLTHADLGEATLTGARLGGADLTDADLSEAELTNADLGEATLTRASLVGATLTGARLGGATLTGARLGGANLTGAFVVGADLTQANLGGAALTGADFFEAILTGADLIEGALSEEQLTSVRATDGINWIPPSQQTD
jgi:hypothetical protein